MADYQRMVSYLYNYENGIAGNNVGYVRMEKKNEQYRIQFQMRMLSTFEGVQVGVLYGKPEQDADSKIQYYQIIGQAFRENGCIHHKEEGTLDELDKLVRGKEITGFILYVDDSKYYLATLDGKQLSGVKLVTKEIQNKQPTVDSQKMVADYKQPTVDSQKMTADYKQPNVDSQKMAADYKQPTVDSQKMTADYKQPTVDSQKMAADYKQATVDRQENEKLKKEISSQSCNYKVPAWFERFPSMYPFEDDEILRCVRIEPKEIKEFPDELMPLANNSFLLQGYYSYRHLILAERQTSRGMQYVLGVPGIYHNRENFMAQMFGFSLFKTVKKVNPVRFGEFGYWCMPIQLYEEKQCG